MTVVIPRSSSFAGYRIHYPPVEGESAHRLAYFSANGSFLLRQRRRARRRGAVAGADVLGTLGRVLFRRQHFQIGIRLGMNLLEKWNAPAAPRSRAAALGELARHLGLALPNEVHEL